MKSFNNHTPRMIHDLYREISDGRLVLQPDFQRRLVWSDRHRTELIETILKGYPFPEIYIADRGIDIQNVTSERVVVDGQQRMHTIQSYVDGNLIIGAKDPIVPYEQLDDDDKQRFLAYEVNVCQIYGASEPEIKEIFRRINLTKYPLNPYEINNAVYDGEFMSMAKEISESIDWDKIPAFTIKDISRMIDTGFILNIMATIEEGGYYSGDDLMGEYVDKLNDSYPNKEKTAKKILDAFKLVESLSLPKKSMWNRKSSFFTLIIELVVNSEIVKHIGVKSLKERLLEFEELVGESRRLERLDIYNEYNELSRSGTNQRKARVRRAEILVNEVLRET